MTVRLIAGPSVEPITLAEAKINLRVTDSALDGDITRWIGEAREMAEHVTGRSFIQQTWEKVLDAFPANEIELPHPPLIGIVSIKYIDPDGVEQTLSANQFAIDSDSEPGYVFTPIGGTWPATQDCINAVRVRYTAGYGPDGSTVPFAIKGWIHLYLREAFKNNGLTVDGQTQLQEHAKRMLDRYTIMVIA